MLSDILVTLGTFYFGFQIGIFYTTYKLRDLILKEAAKQGIPISDLEKNNNIPTKLIIEHINGNLYLYDNDSNTFLCQGNTIEELAMLVKKYKSINNALVYDTKTKSVITFNDGKVL